MVLKRNFNTISKATKDIRGLRLFSLWQGLALAFLMVVVGGYAQDLSAKPIFEGWYKIMLSGKHVGYVAHRYSFDGGKKEFRSTYYNYAKTGGREVIESLDALANDKFNPLSYQYTSKVNDKITLIDAQFEKGKLNATVSDGKQKSSLSLPVKKGVFLSTFLGYLMLNKGIEVGKKFSFQGIAEEDGSTHNGEAFVQSETNFLGQPAYKILVNFKGTKFVSLMSKKGEVLGTRSPLQQVSTELVPTATQATKGFQLNSKSLTRVFGAIPAGKLNALAAPKKAAKAPSPPTKLPQKPMGN